MVNEASFHLRLIEPNNPSNRWLRVAVLFRSTKRRDVHVKEEIVKNKHSQATNEPVYTTCGKVWSSKALFNLHAVRSLSKS